jgi:hypothetical protein
MFIFGGRNNEDLNELHYFNPETNHWTLLSCGGKPVPRRRHSSVFLGRYLFIFGGFDGSFFNDLHCLNVHPYLIPRTASTHLNNLSCMVNNELQSDIRFRINNEIVYAHKSLLFYRFADERFDENGLFFERIVTSKGGIIDFKISIEKSVFLSLIEFIYCGTFVNSLTVEEVKKVLVLA